MNTGKIDIFYKKIPESIRGLIEIAANLVAIVLPLFSGICYIIDIVVSKEENGTANIPINGIVLVVITIIVLIALCIRYKNHKVKFIENLEKYENRLEQQRQEFEKQKSIVCVNNYKFMHDYRNEINWMEFNAKEGKLSEETLHHTVENFLEKSLDNLTGILSNLTGETVCGCVKLIIGGNFNNVKIEDASVRTFARSSNTDCKRRSNDVKSDKKGVPIRGNTDFMSILSDDRNSNDSYFYKGNLLEFNNEMKKIGKSYENTTLNWEEYYKGTIVVPIRIAKKRISNTHSINSYCILGFLCVDTLSLTAFIAEQEENYTYIVKSYAATMFNMLYKYQLYLDGVTQSHSDNSKDQCNDEKSVSQQNYSNKGEKRKRTRRERN
ncbi:MAG TPA: hypothetical protein H9761_05840 [Candidatus Eisenbergiella merdavium]|uniref:Uncharacterized protein n=1 Tax=Candidatus Eisenbergiella merdavium TaxID=2838551 RepID=A0A9D2NEG6_9FIRM|nr:hypothetical protein [Candidatus Eisenbergiella merdavium]